MTRTLVLVIALMGATGLAVGWLATGSPTPAVPEHGHSIHMLKPPVSKAAPVFSVPARREFPLSAEDVANDRETPAVAVTAAGRVLLAFAAQSGDLERTLYLARSDDGGKTFESPVAFRKVPIYRYAARGRSKNQGQGEGDGVTSKPAGKSAWSKSQGDGKGEGDGKETMYSTHVLPRLVAAPDGIYLGWVEAINGGPEVAYYLARTGDGGRTFSEPVRTHGKDAGKPGFTALTVASDGSLLAAWLDGRNKKGAQPFFSSWPAGSDGFEADKMAYAGPDGRGVCPCCDVAVARLSDGSDMVAFRNSDSGHRDIWLARAPRGGAFGSPSPLGRDNWTFQGCPHDGPALAAADDHIYIAWMSAHTGKNRVYAASSTTAEMAFTPSELSAGTPGAQGHPKLAVGASKKVVAVWDESLDAAAPAAPKSSSDKGHSHGHGPTLTGSGRAVMLAVSTGDGARFSPAEPIAPVTGAFQLNPSVVVAPDGAVLAAWSQIDASGKRIVFVRVDPEVARDHH